MPPRPTAAAARLAGRPLALARGRLPALLAFDFEEAGFERASPFVPYTVVEGGIAVVSVLGPLVARGDWLSALFGAVPYTDLVAAVAGAMDDPAVRGVVLEIDSPGGEVAGLFDAVAALRNLRQQSGKPLHALAREAALSAAYAIACAADRIVVTQTAEVGSVGVLALHLDESGADAKAGFAFTYLFAGERKVDGNPHEPLSDRARADLQADVDRLYDELVARMAEGRNLTPEAVRATEARIYRGELGVRAGLADAVGTLESALADLSAGLDREAPPVIRPPAPSQRRNLAMAETEDSRPDPNDPPDPAPTPPAPAAPPTPTPAAPAGNAAEQLRAEYAEIADVAAQAARLGVAVDAAEAMRKGIRPDALRQTVLGELAAKTDAATVIATAPGARAGGDSPIVKRARERATAARA